MPCQADLQVQIELFYVSGNHKLSSSITNGSMGAWQNDDSLTKYITASNTRSLSVTSNLQAISKLNSPIYFSDPNVTTTMAVLFYEAPNGSVAVLSRLAERCSVSCPYTGSENPIYTGEIRNSSWIDNSAVVQEIDDPYCTTPFTSGEERSDTNFSVTIFYRGAFTASDISFIGEAYSLSLESSTRPDFTALCKYR